MSARLVRRVLSHRVSVEAMVEFSLWVVCIYATIGLVWAFFQGEPVQTLDASLRTRLPAGSEVAAFLLVGALWPWQVLGAHFC
ncbi:hypothetical protein BST27_09620 [Mycobacterium intermedium]|uniref:Uncharacterized protein n=1 Tax=Mycobacterium intermedium TaxID=28445 RepID=A0A1E3SDC9_MYCIE|nr:hypothetical protein [Mycobacterium intermedium]MCV6966895.1 hypothetical protein [Mycobacterium intermedium]ODQ99662.1 hypothetical protein BHQ20_16060 [Mycobacterium intermedium]OPE49035.1 hypothetical protein BV508_15580 [Mycobacterium intermedium]ORB07168.1 hypothetical protein BST27_09620 [Mycobacterium intermedium]